jgi:uncharacterized peroxidase-related enzyme
MSYLKQPPFDDDAFPTFGLIRKQFGFLPNFFRAQTMRPDLIDAQVQLIGNTLVKDGALTRRRKEYIFLVCSAANLSTYCVTAHCEIVRMLGIQGPEPEQVAIDHTSTDIPVVDKALLNFALKLNGRPTQVTRHDIEALRTYGFSDAEILETIVVVGVAQFANSVSFGLGTLPDFETSKVVFPR